MACGDLHRGSRAGREAAFLATKLTSSWGVSWPLVWSHEEPQEHRRAGSPGSIPQFRAAELSRDQELQHGGLAPLPPSSRTHEGKLRESSGDSEKAKENPAEDEQRGSVVFSLTLFHSPPTPSSSQCFQETLSSAQKAA